MRFIPLLCLWIVSALWGSHPVVGKLVESQLSPMALTVWRFTLGLLFYIPLLPRLKSIVRLPRRLFWQLALSGLCWAVLYPILYYQSLRELTPVESLLLVNTSPFIAALFAWVALKERMSRMGWLGLLVSFFGVGLLVFTQLSGSASLVGGLLALLAAAAFAGYTVSSRLLFQKLPLWDVLLATSLWGNICLWIVVITSGQTYTVTHALITMTQAGWIQLAYIVIVVNTVAYALYGYGLKLVPTGIASAITFYPQALFAAVIQWIWLGVVPSAMTGVSAIFILAGTALMRKS